MKKDTLEYRMMQENKRSSIPDSKLLTGSLAGKFPIVLDGGRTTLFISDKSKEAEAREKYELRRGNKIVFNSSKKPKPGPAQG